MKLSTLNGLAGFQRDVWATFEEYFPGDWCYNLYFSSKLFCCSTFYRNLFTLCSSDSDLWEWYTWEGEVTEEVIIAVGKANHKANSITEFKILFQYYLTVGCLDRIG